MTGTVSVPVTFFLLIDAGLDDKEKIRTALQETFRRRKTHEVPKTLSPPSDAWEGPYRAIAEDCGVSKKILKDAFQTLKKFWGGIKI